jgi:hypothetical protein
MHGDARRLRHLDDGLRVIWMSGRGVAGGMIVHHTSPDGRMLIPLDFRYCRSRKRSAIEDGMRCTFVIIPMPPGRYFWVTVDH